MDLERLSFALSQLTNGCAPVPDGNLIFVGDGPYLEIAGEFLRYFVEVGKLKPDGTVLDIGSGIGRMASGLSLYLDRKDGRYVGFEPVESGVEWCKEAYSEFSNFEFHCVDLYNELYNPSGRVNPTDYKFPMEDNSADLVVATSVFTHLYESDIVAYAREIGRVLKAGGKLLATVYVFDGLQPPDSERDLVRFERIDRVNPNRRHIANAPPLAAVCYQADYLRATVEDNLERKVELLKGRWQGGPGPWYQDLIIS